MASFEAGLCALATDLKSSLVIKGLQIQHIVDHFTVFFASLLLRLRVFDDLLIVDSSLIVSLLLCEKISLGCESSTNAVLIL